MGSISGLQVNEQPALRAPVLLSHHEEQTLTSSSPRLPLGEGEQDFMCPSQEGERDLG